MNKSKTPVCHFWGGVSHRHRHPSVPNWETVLLVVIVSFEAVQFNIDSVDLPVLISICVFLVA